jgi:hypothetical protein
MVLFVMPRPLSVGHTYRDPEKLVLQGFNVAGVPTTGKPLKLGWDCTTPVLRPIGF